MSAGQQDSVHGGTQGGTHSVALESAILNELSVDPLTRTVSVELARGHRRARPPDTDPVPRIVNILRVSDQLLSPVCSVVKGPTSNINPY